MSNMGNEDKSVFVYHGTSEFFRPGIEAAGIKPTRRRGEVYVSLIEERARLYAACWSVSLHALGVSPSRRGIILRYRLPFGIRITKDQACDFAVEPRHLTFDSLSVVEFAAPTIVETIGLMAAFVGVVRWDRDGYLSPEPYASWGLRGKQFIRRFPVGLQVAGFESAPPI